ncbi:DUF3422 family protein [Sphingobium sp. EP60837]|uniref:DUF3422 family protein n=1 Tax=Sphingobium sp. EP60837 TaxID=1855519 RepID=UPI0007DDE1F1|nr:DUF3422 domain-containing protein [Sphingobium sp. EP60837]ANI80204.1 hypothetical protein EP837_03824 [Sphingobium sp. EP60837]
MFSFTNHPFRVFLSTEMHVRKLPPISAPTRLVQILIFLPPDKMEQERLRLLAELDFGQDEYPDRNFLNLSVDGYQIIWERHTEILSYTFIRPGALDAPFDADAIRCLPHDYFSKGDGQVVRATQIAFSDREMPEVVAASFEQDDLVICEVVDGGATIWSDFRLKPDGFGRLLVVNRNMSGTEAALTIQRVQELGNYRNMALLGLPVAQQWAKTLTQLESRLAELTCQTAMIDADDATLLHDISDLSAELGAIVASTRYRMSASKAYAAMTTERLQQLRTKRLSSFPTLEDFTDRRLLPAVRTCISFSDRLEDLSQRVAWTTALLRTRVDTALSQQNRDLLRSMNHRARLQLRLQETVEGLSVVAITYYLVGILGYVLHGIEHSIPLPHDLMLAMLAPAVLFFLWLAKLRLRHHIDAGEDA